MDLRKFPKEDEEQQRKTSAPGAFNQILPSTSRDNNNVPVFESTSRDNINVPVFEVPEPPAPPATEPPAVVATQPVQEVNPVAIPGNPVAIPGNQIVTPAQIWTNKEMWQYMTLPFTITLALQNLSPFDENIVRAMEITKYLHSLQNANTVYGIPIDVHPLQQVVNVPSSVPAVQTEVVTRPIEAPPLVTPPLQKSRCSKAACESKRKSNNCDVIPVPASNNTGPMNTPNTGVSSTVTHAAQQFSMPSTSKAFPEVVYVESPPKENNQKQNIVLNKKRNIVVKGSKNARAEKRKRGEKSVTPYMQYCTDDQAKQPVQQDVSIPSCSNVSKKIDTSKKSTPVQPKEQGTPKPEVAKGILLPSKQSGEKHSSGKHSKKVRFADQCAGQQSGPYKQAGPSKVTEIPRMVFPIYDKSSKSAAPHSAHKEKNKEIWTIIDKVQPNKDDSLTPPIILQKVTPSRSRHPKKAKTAPVKERATQRRSSGSQKVSSSNSKSHQKKVETAPDKRAIECSVVRRAPSSSQKKPEAVFPQQNANQCSVVQKAPSSKGQYNQQPTTSFPVKSATQCSVLRKASSSSDQHYQTVEIVHVEENAVQCSSAPVDVKIKMEQCVETKQYVENENPLVEFIAQQPYQDVPPLVPFDAPKTKKPTAYERQLLEEYAKERIRKAYNLHETLLAKLGGTDAMPERKLEIDLFRRDLILELMTRQFRVENVDQLRDAIMEHLGDEEKAKSYVDIIESITNQKYDECYKFIRCKFVAARTPKNE